MSKTKIKITIEEVRIKALSPAEYNPRKMTRQVIDAVKMSIKEFGFTDPIVVNKRSWDNDRLVIVGGHKRWMAVKEMRNDGDWRRKTIPCIVRKFTEAEEMALNVALNKIQDEFDLKLLSQVIEDIRKTAPKLIGRIGFSEPELRGLIIDPGVEAMKFSDVANEFLKSHPEEATQALWLYCEPRSEEEFESVKMALGNPGNRMLDMDKIMKVVPVKKKKTPRRKK